MTYQTPCQISETPDDWFIERDGKQYADEDFAIEAHLEKLAVETPGFDRDSVEAWEALVPAAEDQAKKAALVRRRHARDACHVDCILRLQCLEAGLEIPHGTWGGYYQEERREIVRVRDETRRSRGE